MTNLHFDSSPNCMECNEFIHETMDVMKRKTMKNNVILIRAQRIGHYQNGTLD